MTTGASGPMISHEEDRDEAGPRGRSPKKNMVLECFGSALYTPPKALIHESPLRCQPQKPRHANIENPTSYIQLHPATVPDHVSPHPRMARPSHHTLLEAPHRSLVGCVCDQCRRILDFSTHEQGSETPQKPILCTSKPIKASKKPIQNGPFQHLKSPTPQAI